MGLKPDHWIRKMAREYRMIEPFEEKQVRDGVVSYGVSSYGYDVRVANEFKIFTNVFSATVDRRTSTPSRWWILRGMFVLSRRIRLRLPVRLNISAFLARS